MLFNSLYLNSALHALPFDPISLARFANMRVLHYLGSAPQVFSPFLKIHRFMSALIAAVVPPLTSSSSILTCRIIRDIWRILCPPPVVCQTRTLRARRRVIGQETLSANIDYERKAIIKLSSTPEASVQIAPTQSARIIERPQLIQNRLVPQNRRVDKR